MPPLKFFEFLFEGKPGFVSSELMIVDLQLEAVEGPQLGLLVSDP